MMISTSDMMRYSLHSGQSDTDTNTDTDTIGYGGSLVTDWLGFLVDFILMISSITLGFIIQIILVNCQWC